MAIDLNSLKTELLTDPTGLGLVWKTDQQAADLLNTTAVNNQDVNRRKIRSEVKTWEIIEATVPAEYTALSAADKTLYQTVISAGVISPSGTNIRAIFQSLFGVATTTRANLLLLQYEATTRAIFLFGESVASWDVARARAL